MMLPTSLSRNRLACLAAALLLGLAAAGHAQTPAKPADVTLNFVNADVQAVIKAVAEITGKNFYVDPKVTGTVNIVSGQPVPHDLVYPILLSALRAQGFAAVEERGLVKIVPEADAKTQASPVLPKGQVPQGDRIVTKVFQLQYESAAQLLPVLRPMVAPNNHIAAYANNNTLVVTDYAENVRRIERVIQSVDLASASDVQVIKLEHASAFDAAQAIQRLMPEASASPTNPGAPTKLAVTIDARTNSLLVRADSPSITTRLRALVAGIDQPGGDGAGSHHVVYLRNAEATKVAEMLRGLISGEAQGARAPAASSITTPTPSGISPSAAAATAPAATSAPASTIQAFPATNSLVITAPDHVYRSLRAVIDKLDARRAQIFIEAMVAEVTGGAGEEFGVQWLVGRNTNAARTEGFVLGTPFNTNPNEPGANIATLGANPQTIAPGLNLGIIREPITIGGVQIGSLAALARALETEQKANVLATPNVTTLDNEEARFSAGQNVPFITGSFAQPTTGAAVNPFQTIERRDIGLTLKVTPQVAEGNTVKLKIAQEASNVSRDATIRAADLIVNKRSIESTVQVNDGDIIVLGGLIQDEQRVNEDRVPVLGRLPLLGALFRYETKTRTKTNLYVFLKPTVLRDSDAAARLSNERYDYLRNEQGRVPAAGEAAVLPDRTTPAIKP